MQMYPWLRDQRVSPPPTSRRGRWWRFIENRLPNIALFLMVVLLLAFVLYPHMIINVPSGYVGVAWKRFGSGTVLDPRKLKDEGLHVMLPWDQLFLYDLRVQSLTETYNAISSDGVSLTATVNIRFRLRHDAIPTLHQVIGPNYIKLIGPGIASQLREVIAQFTAEQVYSTARQEIQDKIRERTVEKLGDKMMEREGEDSYNVAMRDTITLYDTLLYGIELPAAIVTAINRKTEQYYISEEYKFRVEREKRETERKRIEAEGIRDFQQIVTQNGISDSYLRWRGIEATLQLSQATNSKVVVIGGNKDGLPIILGNMDSPAPTPPPAEDANKERTTAAPPTVPAEKKTAETLSTPHEKVPPAGAAKPAEKSAQKAPDPVQPMTEKVAAKPSTPSSTLPAERGFSWPPTWADVEAYISRKLHPAASSTEWSDPPGGAVLDRRAQ
ncbi:MAG: SPFH domain-containing protein [Xanthobacteraceae bacterium]